MKIGHQPLWVFAGNVNPGGDVSPWFMKIQGGLLLQ